MLTENHLLNWREKRNHSPQKLALAHKILQEIDNGSDLGDAVRRNPLPDGGYVGKNVLVAAYRELIAAGSWKPSPGLLERIRLKPVRTLSGVTTVTVLTQPYPCPGKCIFCPTDARMPKSYLPDEPGAMRALHHRFDPFDQVVARLEALQDVGHPIDKIELLILGGTWSSYRRDYQEWFVRRCFDALNRIEATCIEEAHSINETAIHRNVGLVIETRPDRVDQDEIRWLRFLGVTKVQMGAQSFDDQILKINRRGHTVADTLNAVNLLRAAGFKIVLHWMPNLLGANVQSDQMDFARMWDGFCPDEIKIYPTQLLANAELYEYWLRGEHQPYTTEQLVNLIADLKETIPAYCRLNRVIRDIPSTHVIEGNKRTSLRQDVQVEMKKREKKCSCIRCREVRKRTIDTTSVRLDDLIYTSGVTEEHFLSYLTEDNHLAGFLRLTLPGNNSPRTGFKDLELAAIIREVHIYGQSLTLGEEKTGAAQHIGLGSRLIDEAERIAAIKGYSRICVISAVGTRQYYLGRNFQRGDYYLFKDLDRERV